MPRIEHVLRVPCGDHDIIMSCMHGGRNFEGIHPHPITYRTYLLDISAISGLSPDEVVGLRVKSAFLLATSS